MSYKPVAKEAKVRQQIANIARTGYASQAEREKAIVALSKMDDATLMSKYKRHGTLIVYWLPELQK